MDTQRTNELIEKQICLELHYRAVPQKTIALFLGKNLAHVNAILKPLGPKKIGGDQ